MALIIAVPAAIAGSFFTSNAKPIDGKPCFITGNAGYQLSAGTSANFTVRIDNAAPNQSLRMQLVDDPSAADFVLVDDGDSGDACNTATAVSSIRLDPAAAKPDLTVTLSRTAADYKIYVRSASYTEQDAAALFAVIWQTARKTGAKAANREFAERH